MKNLVLATFGLVALSGCSWVDFTTPTQQNELKYPSSLVCERDAHNPNVCLEKVEGK